MVQKHILIAEDEKHLRLTANLVLTNEGFMVSEAQNGLEALSLLLKSLRGEISPINLLITDIRMPKVDGLQLIEKMMHQGIDIPIIVITGYGNNELLHALYSKGCTEYLSKPFAPQDLVAQVINIFKKLENPKPDAGCW